MKFRFKALLLHLSSSAAVMALIMGSLLTFLIASPKKSRRTLGRDIAIIVLVQLVALGYGSVSLWKGRPLYYAFSVNCLSLVQAYDIEPADAALGRKRNPNLAPHWYSLPRWIWAPLPDDPTQSQKIIASAVTGGSDVIAMPIYYQSFDKGLPALRAQLQRVDDIRFFSPNQKKMLKARMLAARIPTDQVNALAFTGRAHPLLAVFDPASLKLAATFSFD